MTQILVIEDDIIIRELLNAIFTREGYGVTLAENGDQGIEQAKTNVPDAIILDMNMPGKTGWDVLPELRALPGLNNTPLIALSAHHTAVDRDQAYERGCDLYIAKPIDQKLLLTSVLGLLAKGS